MNADLMESVRKEIGLRGQGRQCEGEEAHNCVGRGAKGNDQAGDSHWTDWKLGRNFRSEGFTHNPRLCCPKGRGVGALIHTKS